MHKSTETISTPSSLGQQSPVARKIQGTGETQVQICLQCDPNLEPDCCIPGDGPSDHDITKCHSILFVNTGATTPIRAIDFNHCLLQGMQMLLDTLKRQEEQVIFFLVFQDLQPVLENHLPIKALLKLAHSGFFFSKNFCLFVCFY